MRSLDVDSFTHYTKAKAATSCCAHVSQRQRRWLHDVSIIKWSTLDAID